MNRLGILSLFLILLLSSCISSKVYNLDRYKIPGNDPNGNASTLAKWNDFDSLLTNYYLPINWERNKYVSKRHLVILRTNKRNQKKFEFFFEQYWDEKIEPEQEDRTEEK